MISPKEDERSVDRDILVSTRFEEDLLKFVKNMLDDVYKETKESTTEEEFCVWTEHYNNWIDIVRPLMKLMPAPDQGASMFFFRFVELQNNIMWILVCILFGRYHPAMRELRYVLESIAQAYYLDSEHPLADMNCKLEITKEIDRKRFTRLLDRLDVVEKQKIKLLYSDLSKYVHSTYEELRPAIEEGKIWERMAFGFELEMFRKCAEMTNRVLDAVYLLTLTRFPILIKELVSDTMTLSSLERQHSELTLGYIRSQKLSPA